MQCGAKCFIVEFESEGNKSSESVIARTPAAARKTLRRKYGKEMQVLTVKESRRVGN